MMRGLLLALLWAVASGAAAQIHVRSGLIVPTEVAPGAEDEAAIELFNAGTEAVQMRVYLQDLAFDRGRPSYGAPGTAPRSNAGWLSMPATVLTVLPGQTALVPYTTRVPDEPGLVGSYWSVALIEEVLPEAPSATDDGQRQVRIRRRSRLGVQLITHVGPGELGFEVRDEAVVTGAEGDVLTFTLANTGEMALGPEVLAEVYGPDGALAETVAGGRPILYPGSSITVRLPLTAPRAGHTALVIIDPGADDVFGKEIALDGLPSGG